MSPESKEATMKRKLHILRFELVATWVGSVICLVLQAATRPLDFTSNIHAVLSVIILSVLSAGFLAAIFFSFSRSDPVLLPIKLINSLKKDQRVLWIFVSAAFTFLAIVLALMVLNSRLVKYFLPWKIVFDQAHYLVVFVLLLCLQAVFLIWMLFREDVLTRGFWHLPVIARTLLLCSLVYATILHWAVLAFQVRLFKVIPGWFWGFHPKPFTWRDALFAGLFLLTLLGAVLLMRLRRSHFLGLLLSMGLFYLLQIGFGYIDGGGYDAIRDKFAESTHRIYAEHASDRPDLWDAMTHYEARYGQDLYLGTKPPGVLLIYAGLQRFSTLFAAADTFEPRFDLLVDFLVILLPLLSLLALVAIERLSRGLLDERRAFLPVLLYVTCPNVLLMPLFLDQALYPLLFSAGVWIAWHGIRRQSALASAIFGLYSYLVLFVSFSMLPLLALGGCWLFLEFLLQKFRNFRSFIVQGTAAVAGFLLAAGVFWLVFGYNLVERYQNAMLKHTQLKLYEPGFNPFLLNSLLNNVEMGAWTGFILVLLALTAVLIAAFAIFRHKTLAVDRLAIAAAITYIAILLFSRTRGEVGRIWLFMVPLICILAVRTISMLFKRDSLAVIVVSLLQLITTYLTFKFQDFTT